VTPQNGGVVTNLGPTAPIQNGSSTSRRWRLRQLRGTHPFPWFDLAWRTALSRSTRDEPDTRHVTYRKEGDQALTFTNDSLGGVVLSNENEERLSDSGVDLTVPFDTRLPGTTAWSGLPAKLRAGWNYSHRRRSFAQRRFRFEPNTATQDLTLPPEELFAPGQIGFGGADIVEDTLPTDEFRASEDILAYPRHARAAHRP
jgi:hypothetical protein